MTNKYGEHGRGLFSHSSPNAHTQKGNEASTLAWQVGQLSDSDKNV
jgi:hypothetical protein